MFIRDKKDDFCGYKLEGDFDNNRHGLLYWVGVYPGGWSDERDRLFTEVSTYSSSAVWVGRNNGVNIDPKVRIVEHAFEKAKARILMGYNEGEEYSSEMTRVVQISEKFWTDDEIELLFLKFLKSAREMMPHDYKTVHLPVSGFCFITNISVDKLLYIYGLLNENSYVQPFYGGEPCATSEAYWVTGRYFITAVGISRIKELEGMPQREQQGMNIKIEGDNSRVNINSNDSSTNIVSESKTETFNQIRGCLPKIEDQGQRELISKSIDDMEKAYGGDSFIESYKKFMGLISFHMPIFEKALPVLAQLLG